MQYIKALVGSLVAALTALSVALPDGVTAGEWITVAISALTVGGGVYAAPKNVERNEDGEDGAVSVATACLLVIAAVLLLSWLGIHGHVGR